MRRCFCEKFSNFGTIFAATRFMPKRFVKITWHRPNDMTTPSATSLNSVSTIIQNHFLYCFKVFIGCRRARATRTSIVIDIFLAFLKPVTLQLNLCSAHSRIAKSHSKSTFQMFICTFIFIFYTKLMVFSFLQRRCHPVTRCIKKIC